MFKLIRRISYSVIPRPDRPWEEDRKFPVFDAPLPLFSGLQTRFSRSFVTFFACCVSNSKLTASASLATSNAPQVRRKRRLSSTERDAEEEEQAHKKAREDSATPSVADAEGRFLVPAPRVVTQEVKAVTKGVEEVVLDGKDDDISSAAVAAPESVPLPDEKSGELDEPTSDATPPPIEAPSTTVEEPSKVPAEEPTTIAADDSSDVASSVGDDDSPPEVARQPKPVEISSNPPVQTALGPSDDVTTKK
jgi:hypothetical protein